MNSKEFSLKIESIVKEKRTSYMDAIIDVCDKNEIDLRDSKKLISKEIVQHVEFEARELNLLQGGNPTHILPQ